jgi:uncharacterized protein
MIRRCTIVMVPALVAVLISLCPRPAAAQSLPALTAPVNDFAHLIDSSTVQELDRRIRALQGQTGDAVVVATVDTIEPLGSVEDYALKLFEQAGIGKKGQNNGLLILVAKTERRVRIEVGYDLEEFVTDGYAGDVIRRDFLPRFREGDYSGGLLAGTTRIINRIAERRGVTLTDVPVQATRDPKPARFSGLLPVAIIILFFILSIANRRGGGRRRRSPWIGFGGPFGGGFGGFGGGGFGGFGGGGGGGGGFGGFGGGMSGGGGASGRW